MLPYFKSYHVEKILKRKKRLSEKENDIMELIDKLKYYSGKYENYDYDYGIKLKERRKLLDNYPKLNKNSMTLSDINLNIKGIEASRDRAFDECVKLDIEILKKAKENDIDIEDEIARDYKRYGAKPTFRTGNSQGKDMIKNINRITEISLKKFK